MLLYFTIKSLTYGMHCLITLWPQGVFLVSIATYLIMQTMLEMTFLLLVTISIVWYVFLLLTICFFYLMGEGTSKWRFGSSLVSCHVFYLLSLYFGKVINWQINWLIDWLIDWSRAHWHDMKQDSKHTTYQSQTECSVHQAALYVCSNEQKTNLIYCDQLATNHATAV